MANTDNAAQGFKPVQNLAGGAIPVWAGRYRSTTDIATGNVVYATAGYIRAAATQYKEPLGIAVTPVTTADANTSYAFVFWPAVDWLIFYGQCSGTFTQAKVWTQVDVEGTAGSATANFEVNEDATTAKHIQIIGYDPVYSVGMYTRVYFTFTRSKFGSRSNASLGIAY